jgi:hypothetical protein
VKRLTLAGLALLGALLPAPIRAAAQESDDPYPHVARYQRFEREFRSALANADAAAMALLVTFPLTVNEDTGAAIQIANARALQARFDEVFPPHLRERVNQSKVNTEPDRIGERFLIADGAVWLELVEHQGPLFRVVVVNAAGRDGHRRAGRLLYACETPKHRIVIDQLDGDENRYRAWNLPHFPPDKPDLELRGSSDVEGRGGCSHTIHSFVSGDTRIVVAEPGCGEDDWVHGDLSVEIKGKPAGDWICQ